jgi:hypothetical protein
MLTMTRIIVLWGEKENARLAERGFSTLECRPAPCGFATLENVDINGKPVVVGTLSGRCCTWTPREIAAIENVLFFHRAEAATVIEFDSDAALLAAGQAFNHERPKSVVQ